MPALRLLAPDLGTHDVNRKSEKDCIKQVIILYYNGLAVIINPHDKYQ
jgi:hypothetical protein